MLEIRERTFQLKYKPRYVILNVKTNYMVQKKEKKTRKLNQSLNKP